MCTCDLDTDADYGAPGGDAATNLPEWPVEYSALVTAVLECHPVCETSIGSFGCLSFEEYYLFVGYRATRGHGCPGYVAIEWSWDVGSIASATDHLYHGIGEADAKGCGIEFGVS